MNISKLCITILKVVILLLIIACSNTEESDEKNDISKTTDKIAYDAVDTIRKPINKANDIELLSNDRTREIREAAKQE